MEMNAAHIVNLAAAVAPPEDGIISRTVHSDERLKAVVFGFSGGQELSEHTAALPAVMHFLSGVAEVTLGGEKSAVSAGSWISMPAGMPHGILAKTPVTMLLLLLK
jgi:quercetin dioxygenase-like cupin family protein